VFRAPGVFLAQTWPEIRSRRTQEYLGPIEYELAGTLAVLGILQWALRTPVAAAIGLGTKPTRGDGGPWVLGFLEGVRSGWATLSEVPSWWLFLSHVAFALALWVTLRFLARLRGFRLYDSFAAFSYSWGTFIFPALVVMVVLTHLAASDLRPSMLSLLSVVLSVVIGYLVFSMFLLLSYCYAVAADVDWRASFWTVVAALTLLVGLDTGFESGPDAGFEFAVIVLAVGVFLAPLVHLSRDSLRRCGRIDLRRIMGTVAAGWFIFGLLTVSRTTARFPPGSPEAQGARLANLLTIWLLSHLVWLGVRRGLPQQIELSKGRD
jgi:hypothetical protein